MSKRAQQRFAPYGALAVHPKAFGAMFDERAGADDDTLDASGVAVVSIRGPLMHHADYCFDSYESIRARVAKALAMNPRVILLDVDSPGGLVSGAFDTARELRRMCAEAGVELRAHVEAQATSAAYALATAASWIGVSQSASIGSIGVIDMLIDVTAQNEAMGVNVQVITSGARKADGNADAPITSNAIEATQARVDELAAMFFDLVAAHGWGGTPEQVAALQASVVTGEQAVRLGLASAIATRSESLAFDVATSGDGAVATENGKEELRMATPMEDAVASLRSVAEGEDKEEAKNARSALKALGAEMPEDEPDAEGDEGPDAEGDEDESEAEGDDPPADKDESESKAHALALKAMAEVHAMKASAAREKASAERSRLLASRPDFAPEMVAILSSPKTPLATVRKMVADLAKGPARTDRVAAAATATGTRGEAQGDGLASRLPPEEKARLDLQMGLTKMTAETVNEGHRLTFGARRPVAADAAKGK